MNLSKRILIVDDDPDILEVLRLNLEVESYSVALARDASETFHYTFNKRPDLIILDLMLPGMDGYQICRQLKEDVRSSNIPVLILSARVSEEARKESLRCGADGYLPKPFNRKHLLESIDRLLSRPPNSLLN